MTDFLVGAGGWAYFKIPKLEPLVAYSKAFDFVEVNSSFYQIPPLKEAEKWRKIVPQDFRFSVRAHRSITHKHMLKPTEEALEALNRTAQVCRILDSDIMHLQTPRSLKPTRELACNLRDLVSSADLADVELVLEVRSTSPPRLPTEFARQMQELGLIHCTDLSKGEKPAYDSDTLYTRLFGRGEHNIYQPTDNELEEIDHNASDGNHKRVVMSFHFARMYKDAARLKIFKKTGRFPKITGSTGLPSLEEVLSEDSNFPSSKNELVRAQGWKLFDLDEKCRVRAADFLQRLPNKTYRNLKEVIQSVETTAGDEIGEIR